MKNLTLAALAVVANISFAQTQMDFVPRNVLNFAEKAGVMEFSGNMIVRPLQVSAYKRLGMTPAAAELNHVLAEAKIADIITKYISPIDVYVVKIPNGYNENSYARELMKTGLYEYVEPDYTVFPAYTPNDPQLVNQWSHTDNNSTNAWEICRGNSAVTIAITDTGVHVTHEDLVGSRLPGANSATAADVSTVKTEAVDGVAWIKDLHGHGTHTTGIAAATGNNALGVAGVNLEGTKHYMVRVSDSSGGGSSLSALSIAALWASTHGARIISTSYTGVQNSIMGTTGTTVKNNNALWFYAAGNDGLNYGAAVDWPDVQIIGSIDNTDLRSSFSAYGIFTDCFAPGGNILSTVWNSDTVTNSYTFMSGTSMATPYAAGIAAMVLSENPAYSAQRVQDIVNKSSITMNNASLYGWGRVNLWNAMGRVPNSINVSLGNYSSGVLADLNRAEGSSYVLNRGLVPTLTSPKFQFVTQHNVPNYAGNNYGEIDVISKVSMSTSNNSFTLVHQILNVSTGQYETIGSTLVTGNVFEAVKTVNQATYANYISGGVVSIRTQVYQTSTVPTLLYSASIDQITVRTLRETE